MQKKLVKAIVPIVFLAMLFSFTIINLIKPQRVFSESENRYLQAMPKFSIDSLLSGKFITEFEEYVTDQFIWRDGFIGIKTETEHLAQKKDTNGVFFGKDGYLIERHTSDDVDKELLARNTQRLNEFMQYCESTLGKDRAYAMLVPTAGSILTDKLPAFAPQLDQNLLLDEIDAGLQYGNLIDVRGALSEHSSEYIYYKTDHHWTTLGAYYAYREWCAQAGIKGSTEADYDIKSVSDSFYGTIYSKARLMSTKPDKMYAYNKKNASYKLDYNMGEKQTDTLYDESYLEKRDKYSYYLGGNNPIVKITSQNATESDRKLLVIKDSYAHSFVPFLADDVAEVHMLDLRYLNMSIKEYMQQNDITDVLFLYNIVSFAKETTLSGLNK